MSDYVRNKVIRIPWEKYKHNFKYDEDDIGYSLQENYPVFNHYPYGFDYSYTYENYYIDFILSHSYGEDCGEWGKVRLMNDNEKNNWYPFISTVIPDIDMNDCHIVEYCWYNCSEPPDYYEMNAEADSFYADIGIPDNYKK